MPLRYEHLHHQEIVGIQQADMGEPASRFCTRRRFGFGVSWGLEFRVFRFRVGFRVYGDSYDRLNTPGCPTGLYQQGFPRRVTEPSIMSSAMSMQA